MRNLTKQEKPFLYSEPLNQFDKITIGFYVVFSIGFLMGYAFGFVTDPGMLMIYISVPQFCFVFLLYVSLRNFKVYLIWLSFSMINLIIYLGLLGIHELRLFRNLLFTGSVDTIIMLLLFQLMRYISLNEQAREFVNPAKANNGKDLIENRQVSNIDYIISVFYFFSFIGLMMISLYILKTV